jgi:hypothetical protein
MSIFSMRTEFWQGTGGKYHATGRNVISKDGKTMTQTATGTDAEGKPVSATTVFDKQ